MTPRRKKTLKVKEKLDDNFLRRSKRISEKLQGYKNVESAQKAKEAEETMEETEPMPLAVIPPAATEAAPHLSVEIMEGIARGFLQIQPESVSAALLNKDNNDE